jgi:hypothetical protein
MAKKLYLRLQSPVIELKISCRDGGGTQASFTVGFRRHGKVEAEDKLKAFQDLFSSEGVKTTQLDDFIKDDIMYVKDIDFDVEDTETGALSHVSVKDSRKEKKGELWEDSDECLTTLKDMLFDSNPYATALYGAFPKALVNIDLSQDLGN